MTDRLRIALSCLEYPTGENAREGGGIGTYVRTVARGFAKRGHDVHVITSKRARLPRDWQEDGVFLHQVELLAPDTRDPKALMAYSRSVAERLHALEKEKPWDVVHVAEWAAEAWAYVPPRDTVLSIFIQAPSHVIREHEFGTSTEVERQIDELERWPLERADLVSTPSFLTCDKLLESWFLDRDKVVRVPQPLDVETFCPGPASARSDGDPVIVCVNRLTPLKGPQILVRAAAIVHRSHPRARFRLVGRTAYWDGRLADDVLRELARECGLPEDRLELVGGKSREEIPDLLRDATLCANPSVSESYCYTSAEALACGKPLVLTSGQGITEDLQDGKDCLIVPPHDPEALAAAVCRLLEDPGLRERLSAAGRKTMEEKAAAGKVAERLETAFGEALQLVRARKRITPRRVNVAILTYNALDKTKMCIEALRQNAGPECNIFIQDNLSTDGSREWLARQESDTFHVFLSEKNRGVPGGRNDLFRRVLPHLPDDGFVVFLDNDVEVKEGWTESFLEAFGRNPSAGVASAVGHTIVIHDGHRELLPSPDEVAPVDVGTGFSFWVRASTAREVGLFDEKLGLFWHEDDDYCVRTLQQGYEVYRVPTDRIVHHEHASGVADDGIAQGGSLKNQRYLIQKWRSLGYVDDECRIRKPFALVKADLATRRRLQEMQGRETPIPAMEVVDAVGHLESMLLHPDPAATFQANRFPVSPTLRGLVALNLEQSRRRADADLTRRLETIEEVFARSSYTTALRALLPSWPAPSAATRTGRRLSKVCDARDWNDPEWLLVADEMLEQPEGCDWRLRHRQTWEYVQLLYGLLRLGALHDGARGLSIAAGREALMYALARRTAGIVAIDRYDADAEKKFGVPLDLPDDPERYAPFAYPKDRLSVQRMDARRLRLEDGSFDFVVCASSLPHFGMREGAVRVLSEMARVVKPGGIIALSTDLVVNDARDPDRFSPHDLVRDLVGRVGLSLVEDIDFTLGPETLEGFSDCPDHSSRLPHFVHRQDDRILTSCVLFLERAVVPTGDTAPREPARFTKSRGVRVGIDARTFSSEYIPSRAIAHPTWSLIGALAERAPDWSFTLYGDQGARDALASLLRHPNVSFEWDERFDPDDVDLMHVPDPLNVSLGFEAPLRMFRCPRTTVFLPDLSPLRTVWQRWPRENRSTYLARLRQIARSRAVVVSPSLHTREQLCRSGGLTADRVQVLPQAPILGGGAGIANGHEEALLAKLGIEGRYFLHVGSLSVSRDFDTVLRAFTEIHSSTGVSLVVVGPLEGLLASYAQVAKKKSARQLIFPGFLPRKALDLVMRRAVALIDVSRHEGMGLTVKEAMALCCPVIAARCGALPEVVGDAGILVEGGNETDLARALVSVAGDPDLREGMVKRGVARMQGESWNSVAGELLELWKSMLEGGSRRASPEPAPSPLESRTEEESWSGSCAPSAFRDTAEADPLPLLSLSPGDCAPSAAGTAPGHHDGDPEGLSAAATRLASSIRSAGSCHRTVIWHAPLLDPSGYADEARQFVLGLDARGEKVRAVSLNWSDKRAALAPDEARRLERLLTTTVEAEDAVASIWHIFPRYFRRNPRAVLNVGRTTFETDRIPADWVPLCNAMDEIWVPTDFNLETFQKAGVDGARLFKVPPGLDTAAYTKDVAPIRISDARGFNFLSVFDWTLRKGWDVLLRAYIEEFDEVEDVALVLKLCSSLGYTGEQINLMVQSFIENNLGRDPSSIPEVVLLHQDLTQEQMPALYRAVDAYVMASRGEGWGRPYMEAMASGLPVIGTGWGGNTEFMTEENSYLIASKLVPVPEAAVREAAHFRGHFWAEPDVEHLRGLLREVHEDREGARRKGARARQEILSGYGRDRVAQAVSERLDRHPSLASGTLWGASSIAR